MSVSNLTFAEWVDLLYKLVISSTAITSVILGIKGFSKWRQELRGKTEYDVARRLLRSALAVRDSIIRFRSPFMFSDEWAGRNQSAGQATSESPEEEELQNRYYAYRRRLNTVDAALREMSVDRLEAEALWGKDMLQLCKAIAGHVVELEASIEVFFRTKLDASKGAPIPTSLEPYRAIFMTPSGPDKFFKSLESSIADLEAKLRPFIQH